MYVNTRDRSTRVFAEVDDSVGVTVKRGTAITC